MSKKPDKQAIADALAKAFGVRLTPDTTKFEDMDYSKVQVLRIERHPLINVFGEDGTWTFTVEIAQDDTGDIEAYAAGNVLDRKVVDALTRANVMLNGFLVGGLRMFCLNPDYAVEDRDLARKLMDRIEALQGRPQHSQA